MKYYVITCLPEEKVLISYMSRNFCAFVKRLKTRVKLYISEEFVKDRKSFVSLAKHTPNKPLISLNYGRVPFLEKLSACGVRDFEKKIDQKNEQD